ncbi:MAG TPA: VWA domain-containing protein [Candidatus Sulfopaludibacter sp.]|jgi:Ca-activated chloride channel family protein|nr:VWA domain-containing protein [Candidatus Sulfopaludibacter sp.]
MRTSLWLCLLAVLLPAQESIRVDVHLVNVGFSVRDAAGRLVTDLTQDDVEVFEDGVPQKVAFFARSSDVPLKLGLLMDVSGSQDSFVKPHVKDLQTFLKSVLGPQDQAFMVCFGNRLRLVADFTNSPKDLINGLEMFHKGKVEFPEIGPRERRILGTAFYDSIYHSVNQLMVHSEGRRKALIIFSDGEDNSSAHHMLEAIEAAQASNVLLFCVRYTEARNGVLNARNKYGIGVMERIARETGGADFDAREKGLKSNFEQIGEQLRSSYELAYHSTDPTGDGSFRKIKIRSKRPDLTVRAKTGYFAAR